SDDDELHQFRIATKRLRYALELAGPATGAETQQRLYDDLSSLQDRLGEVCDHLAAVGRLAEWLDEPQSSSARGKLVDLLEHEEKSLAECRKSFALWWSAK